MNADSSEAQPVTHRAFLISTSPEDDAAFVALADLSTILANDMDCRVIGGQMVNLLITIFPAEGIILRRTGDADGGIPVEIAATGKLHHALTDAGYRGESGNRYLRGYGTISATIDLLIPSFDGRFKREVRGDRGFDAMPGLSLALAGDACEIDVIARLRDGSELEFHTRTPLVEAAVLLKASAYGDRHATTVKDALDISNLFEIFDRYGAEVVGRWRLNEPKLIGARKDAARNLHELARTATTGRLDRTGIRGERLAYLIRKYVSRV